MELPKFILGDNTDFDTLAGLGCSEGQIPKYGGSSKMFVVGTVGDDVNEYTLSTPFDVSTASFVDSFSVAGQETSPESVAFSPAVSPTGGSTLPRSTIGSNWKPGGSGSGSRTRNYRPSP